RRRLRELTLPGIERVLADAEPLRNLRYRISTLGDLGHRIALELVSEIWLPHRRLLSSKLGKKASTNLGAIHLSVTSISRSLRYCSSRPRSARSNRHSRPA